MHILRFTIFLDLIARFVFNIATVSGKPVSWAVPTKGLLIYGFSLCLRAFVAIY